MTNEAETRRLVAERTELLSKKYTHGMLSPEESSRFEELSERIRDLFPWVTDEDFRTLQEIADALNASEESSRDD